ncbi:MAG: FliA/WhiG family RNA polymerase sigma factor [Oligoflexia bacterium]|nr:FliA/WhiG family RNA polymerase sigma factor [Oligoflexia bacterium]
MKAALKVVPMPQERAMRAERRRRARTAPGFRSRLRERRVEGLTKAELIVKYERKVRFIAAKLIASLPDSVEIDDLVSVGYIGLMDAADKFNAARGVKFSTYAEFRIRGAILDELRRQDWVPHCARGRAKAVDRAYHEVERTKGRRPTEAEVSEAMGVTPRRLENLRKNTGQLVLLSLESSEILSEAVQQIQEHREGGNPYSEVLRKDARAFLEGLFGVLPEDCRSVLSLYYFRGLNLKEISQILGVSESRISQLHTEAIFRLRQQMDTNAACPRSLFNLLLEAA